MHADKIKILLVEDNAVAQKVETKLLEQMDWEVDVADTGTQALELFSQNKYHAVLVDIVLPDIDGLTLAETLRAREGKNPAALILALSAYEDNEYQNRATWVGMDGYVVKPLSIEKCQKILEAFTSRQRKHSMEEV